MADLPVQFKGTVVDGMAIPGQVISYLSLPDTSTLAQMASAIGVWAAAVDGCIDGAFQQVLATLAPTLPGGLKAATGATWLASRIGQTGVLTFSATGTSRRYGQALPALSSAVIVADNVDMTNAAIAALIALLLNPTGYFTNPQNQSLEAALDALLSFRQYAYLAARTTRL
jgi:hypothetical protein